MKSHLELLGKAKVCTSRDSAIILLSTDPRDPCAHHTKMSTATLFILVSLLKRMVDPAVLASYDEMPYAEEQQSYMHGQEWPENRIVSDIDT